MGGASSGSRLALHLQAGPPRSSQPTLTLLEATVSCVHEGRIYCKTDNQNVVISNSVTFYGLRNKRKQQLSHFSSQCKAWCVRVRANACWRGCVHYYWSISRRQCRHSFSSAGTTRRHWSVKSHSEISDNCCQWWRMSLCHYIIVITQHKRS